jgi:hypothetical protein
VGKRQLWRSHSRSAILIAGVIRAANQRHLAGLQTRHFDHPAYRACVAGTAICIVRIVTRSKPTSAWSFQPKHNTDDAKDSAWDHGSSCRQGGRVSIADRLRPLPTRRCRSCRRHKPVSKPWGMPVCHTAIPEECGVWPRARKFAPTAPYSFRKGDMQRLADKSLRAC